MRRAWRCSQQGIHGLHVDKAIDKGERENYAEACHLCTSKRATHSRDSSAPTI
jgi:hypothetical protein